MCLCLGMMNILGIGSCRIYRPLRSLHKRGMINLLNPSEPSWFTHSIGQAVQYLHVLAGEQTIEGEWRELVGERTFASDLAEPDLLSKVHLVVLEISVLREALAGSLCLHIPAVETEAARLKFDPKAATRRGAGVEWPQGHLLHDGLKIVPSSIEDIQSGVDYIKEHCKAPVLLVDHLFYKHADGSTIPARDVITETLPKLTGSKFWSTRPLIERHGQDTALLDWSHYREDFEPLVGDELLKAAIDLRKTAYRTGYFKDNISRVTLDNWLHLPDPQWQPNATAPTLEECIPVNWDDNYRKKYKQDFQPVAFYNNCIQLSNFADKNSDMVPVLRKIFDRLFRRMMAFTSQSDGYLFVRNDFEFVTATDVIPHGWSGGIMNAFVLSGMLRALDHFDEPEYRNAIKGLAHAHKVVHFKGGKPPERWFTYVDERNNLWFDEYPLASGEATLVLNGHIFNVLALAQYGQRTGDNSLRSLLRGGLQTLRERAKDFRRRGKINMYALRQPNHSDYSPVRTIRQQVQLYRLTGDESFRRNATAFYQDIRPHIGTRADRYIESINPSS